MAELPTKLLAVIDDAPLAQRLQLPLVGMHPLKKSDYEFVLMRTDQGLVLQQTGAAAPGPVMVDFVHGKAAFRRGRGAGELIVKAIGGAKNQRPTVLDATAGLGRDSFVLASWGYPVLMLERSAVVGCLLEDGLARARATTDDELQEVVARLQLHCGEAVEYLRSLPADDNPDVIYIDPMFPPSRKSALVKKEMRAFHQLVGADQDSDALLAAALDNVRYRVVVKRPRKASFLADRKPAFSHEGKAVRFDIYSRKAFSK